MILFIILLTQLSFIDSSSKCSYLGILDGDKKCICENGFVGKECEQINYTSPPTMNTYENAWYSNSNPTWGGGIVLNIDKSKYSVLETFTVSEGQNCWMSHSTCAIWKDGKLLSYIGFGNGYEHPQDVPYCHNSKISFECNYEKTRCYLVIYAIFGGFKGIPKRALFTPARYQICQFNKKPQPPQFSYVGFVLLKSSIYREQLKEAKSILETSDYVIDINNSKISGRVNSKFTWKKALLELSLNNPVNPQPLVSSLDNFVTFEKNDEKNEYFKILSIRYKSRLEWIAVYSIPGNTFIWETKGTIMHRINYSYNIEDPYFFKSIYGIHMVLHAFGQKNTLWSKTK